MIEKRMGQLEQAAASYERAIELGERRYVVFEQLIGLLDKLNRSVDVERYVTRLESYVPLSQGLAEIAANQHLRQDRPELAVQIARKAAEIRPSDALTHLWLGRRKQPGGGEGSSGLQFDIIEAH
jgi:tetratricopeptide (TPR) repeat protein